MLKCFTMQFTRTDLQLHVHCASTIDVHRIRFLIRQKLFDGARVTVLWMEQPQRHHNRSIIVMKFTGDKGGPPAQPICPSGCPIGRKQRMLQNQNDSGGGPLPSALRPKCHRWLPSSSCLTVHSDSQGKALAQALSAS